MRIHNTTRISRSFLLFAALTIFGSLKLSVARPDNGNTKDVVSPSGSEAEVRRFDIPGFYQRRYNSNSVKTLKKDSEPPFPQAGPSARESSMIQAFGMPKRVLANDGEIERVSLDRISALDGKVDKINFATNEAGISAYGMPKKTLADNGVIEKGENLRHEPKSAFRTSAVAEAGKKKKNEEGFLEDLATAEAKIFRPLFVYRQQVADRYRVNRRRNPIYGAYQYGRNRPRNFRHGYNY